MSWAHIEDTSPIARKRYRCVGCWEFIEKGETHLARRSFGDDGPVTDRWHPECEQYAFVDNDPTWDSVPGSFSRKEAIEYLASTNQGGQ